MKEKRMRDYEFVLEDLELAFPKQQLEEITEQWNKGAELDYIAKKYKRQVDEVFLALFHQARNGKIKRPFAYRK
ncbi:hypothetical protein JYK21_07260 [Ralstonia pickettii]|nr:hypothetical protein [Ralstonia pickettii]